MHGRTDQRKFDCVDCGKLRRLIRLLVDNGDYKINKCRTCWKKK